MPNHRRVLCKRLARFAGKKQISDLTQDDIDRLWLERITDAQKFSVELHELAKLTADRLRKHITSVSSAGRWDRVTLELIENHPRAGLSECEHAVLDDLVERKRRRNAKKRDFGSQESVPQQHVRNRFLLRP